MGVRLLVHKKKNRLNSAPNPRRSQAELLAEPMGVNKDGHRRLAGVDCGGGGVARWVEEGGTGAPPSSNSKSVNPQRPDDALDST
jgi:hypothetical protein